MIEAKKMNKELWQKIIQVDHEYYLQLADAYGIKIRFQDLAEFEIESPDKLVELYDKNNELRNIPTCYFDRNTYNLNHRFNLGIELNTGVKIFRALLIKLAEEIKHEQRKSKENTATTRLRNTKR